MEPDLVARVAAAGGLVLGVFNAVVSIVLWWRAGPRLRVKLSLDEHGQQLLIEVINVGRSATIIRRVAIHDVIKVQGSSGTSTATLLSLDAEPADDEPIERSLAPTAWLIARVPLQSVARRWDPNARFTFVAFAERGDGRRRESRPLSITTPPLSDS